MSSAARQTSWLVTGANRGIGFELVKQLLDTPSNLVVATCRNPDKATALSDLKTSAKGTLRIIRLDVADFVNVRASAKEVETILGDIGLDYLVNNAGIVAWDSVFDMDAEKLLDVLRTNTVGPALISQVYLPLLEKGRAKKILHISSTAGSIGEFEELIAEKHRKLGAYALSKIALNMLAYKQKVARPDLVVIALCPGWVKTDMGGEEGPLEPEESIAGIIKIITNATSADSGKFLRYNGEKIPWPLVADVRLGCTVVSSSGVTQNSHSQVGLLLSTRERGGVRVRVTLSTRIGGGAHLSEAYRVPERHSPTNATLELRLL